MRSGRAALAGPFLAWWLVWMVPGCGAAWLLLAEVNADGAGVALHAVVLQALMLALLLPFTADILDGRLPRPQRICLALLAASLHWLLLGFYALSAIGHRFWGDWINADLILAYAPHTPDLLRALDISRTAVFTGAAAAWALLLAMHHHLLRATFAARAQLLRRTGRGAGLVILVAMVAALMLLYRSYVIDRDYWGMEPLRQSAIRASFGEAGQNQFFTPERLREERDAIAAYRPAPATARPRPLVLIIVDALRSDQMGVYGGPVDNTPFLSALHKGGRLARIDDVYSVCTVSYCGVLGTLSSKYWHRITPQPWNLADALKLYGYESRFLLGGDHTSYFGMRKMYGNAVDLLRDGSDQREFYSNDDRLVLRALDDAGWPASKPGFLYVHLMSVHRLGLIDERHKRWNGATAPAWSAFEKVDAREYNDSRARYHNGVLQADDMIRQVFERLERFHVLDDAVVVITSDHGEYLGELGRWSHGQPPHEPAVRIPLLIFDRQRTAPYPPRALKSQVDIAPTLLEAIGATIPANWTGIPLQRATTRDAIVVESAETSGVVAVLGATRYKYLKDRADGQEHLYEIRPGGGAESIDLAADARHATSLSTLRATHERLLGSAPR